MKIEAVIFDWAGTTVDFGCFAPVMTFMELFKEYGIEATLEETRKPMGMLKWDHIKTMLEMPNIKAQWVAKYQRPVEDKDIDEMHDTFTKNLMKILDQHCDIKPYTLECVSTLRNMGIKIGSTTGYTDEMMSIVTRVANENGYRPDYWITPNSVHNHGRPYPYMIFHNMEALLVKNARHVIKVGDTISDIQEGMAAGVITVGILEGSSMMGLTKGEFDALNDEEKDTLNQKLREAYYQAGADYTIKNLSELVNLVKQLEGSSF